MRNRGLVFLDKNDELSIWGLNFPVQFLNPTSPPSIELHLWNRKGETIDKIAENIEITVLNYGKTSVGDTEYHGQEIVDDTLIQARSNGIVGSGIIDDAQSSWTAIGGSTVLSVGDIPIGCARKIFFRLKSALTTNTTEAVFFVQVSYNYRRRQVFVLTYSQNEHRFLGAYFFGGVFF
jgi:hypothetical protein